MNKKDLDALNELYSSVYGVNREVLGELNKPPVQKPKPFEYSSKNLGDRQNVDFRSGGGNAAVGDSYTAADVVARGRAALKAKPAKPAAPRVWDTEFPYIGSPSYAKLKKDNQLKAKPAKPATAPTAPVRPATAPTAPVRPAAAPTAPVRPAASAAPKPAASSANPMDTWARSNPGLAGKVANSSTPQAGKDVISARVNADNDRGPSTPTPSSSSSTTSGSSSSSGETDRLKKALDIKKSDVTSSYQWPSAKTIREIAGAYASIYEAKKKVDQDEDGDNDFADIRIARMIASGVPKAKAIAMVKNKSYNEEVELDEGIGSAIRGLFGKSKPSEQPSRGEELRSKYGSPARFGRPPRTPSGEKMETRHDRTLRLFGKKAADKVHKAAFNMLGIAPRDTGSHDPGTVTSGNFEGRGNRANRRMGNPPEDTRFMPYWQSSQVSLRGLHDSSRGVKKPLARSTNAEEVELWVNELIEEGYDLSGYTWDDMFEIYEATAMAKRGYDETEIRNKIAKSTGGGDAADRATALANKETFGRGNKAARQKYAATQRGDFRDTTSSNSGLHGYAHKSNDPAVKAKQAARGAQRSALTPREKKELNREAYAAYEFVASYLLENNFASTVDDANVIINNMSEGWFESIMEEKKPLPVAKMKRKESKLLDNEEGQLQALRTDFGSKERKARIKELERFDTINGVRTSVAKRGGKQQHPMPEVGRFKPKDED